MKQYVIILSLVCAYILGNAQTQLNNSNIARSMQNLADTTIIVQYPSVWNKSPLLYFLSKKGDTINTYFYQQPKSRKIDSKIPKAIAHTLFLNNLMDYINEPVGLNQYFNIKNIDSDTLRNVWNTMRGLQLWDTEDDAAEGSGCPITKKSNLTIHDGGGLYILLVTRADIKPLNFYAPEEFEKFCPGRKGRQTAFKLSNLIYRVFKEDAL